EKRILPVSHQTAVTDTTTEDLIAVRDRPNEDLLTPLKDDSLAVRREKQSASDVVVSGQEADDLPGLAVDEGDAVLDRVQAAQPAEFFLGLRIAFPGRSEYGQLPAYRVECHKARGGPSKVILITRQTTASTGPQTRL